MRRGARCVAAVLFPGIRRLCGAADMCVNHCANACIYRRAVPDRRAIGGSHMARQPVCVVGLVAMVLSAAATARAADGDISSVMSSISVNAGENRGNLSTVNGSIRVGEG